MSRITAPEGEDHTDDLWQIGDLLLALGREQPFGGELGLALLQHRHQRADACGRDVFDNDLVF